MNLEHQIGLEHRPSWTLIELRETISEYKRAQDLTQSMSRIRKGKLSHARSYLKARKHPEDLRTQLIHFGNPETGYSEWENPILPEDKVSWYSRLWKAVVWIQIWIWKGRQDSVRQIASWLKPVQPKAKK